MRKTVELTLWAGRFCTRGRVTVSEVSEYHTAVILQYSFPVPGVSYAFLSYCHRTVLCMLFTLPISNSHSKSLL